MVTLVRPYSLRVGGGKADLVPRPHDLEVAYFRCVRCQLSAFVLLAACCCSVHIPIESTLLFQRFQRLASDTRGGVRCVCGVGEIGGT